MGEILINIDESAPNIPLDRKRRLLHGVISRYDHPTAFFHFLNLRLLQDIDQSLLADVFEECRNEVTQEVSSFADVEELLQAERVLVLERIWQTVNLLMDEAEQAQVGSETTYFFGSQPYPSIVKLGLLINTSEATDMQHMNDFHDPRWAVVGSELNIPWLVVSTLADDNQVEVLNLVCALSEIRSDKFTQLLLDFLKPQIKIDLLQFIKLSKRNLEMHGAEKKDMILLQVTREQAVPGWLIEIAGKDPEQISEELMVLDYVILVYKNVFYTTYAGASEVLKKMHAPIALPEPEVGTYTTHQYLLRAAESAVLTKKEKAVAKNELGFFQRYFDFFAQRAREAVQGKSKPDMSEDVEKLYSLLSDTNFDADLNTTTVTDTLALLSSYGITQSDFRHFADSCLEYVDFLKRDRVDWQKLHFCLMTKMILKKFESRPTTLVKEFLRNGFPGFAAEVNLVLSSM